MFKFKIKITNLTVYILFLFIERFRAHFEAAKMNGFYPPNPYDGEVALDLSSRSSNSTETPQRTPSPYSTTSISEPSPTGSHENIPQNASNGQTNPINNHSLNYLAPSARSSNFASAGSSQMPIYHHQYQYQGGNQTTFSYDTNCDMMITPRGLTIPIEERIRDMPPFMLNSVVYQQHIAQAQLSDHVDQDSPAHSPTISSPIDASVPSTSTASSHYPMIVGRDGKLARPFKAYPRDPLTLSGRVSTSEAIDAQSNEDYKQFRKRIIKDICDANGGAPTLSNPKMRRTAKPNPTNNSARSDLTVSSSSAALAASMIQAAVDRKNEQEADMEAQADAMNDEASLDNDGSIKDSAYYERRKKNNAAAKKSRDRRRIKEDEIAIRAAFLERENLELKVKLAGALQHIEMMTAAMQAMPMQAMPMQNTTP